MKYFLVFILAVLLICNYLSKKILGFFLKEEPTQKQDVIYKSILYLITVAVVIYMMIIA